VSDSSDLVASSSHVLRVNEITLVGGNRTVEFQPGLSFVRGDITTGKTTLVRLIRGLLGSIPKQQLPPETELVRALAGQTVLGEGSWRIYRPMVTTRDTPVEVAEVVAADDEGDALRLPAAGPGGYGEFLLTNLGLPVVYVPRARQDPNTDLSPVTINDWLNYCIVTGDELDLQVFGHRENFRNHKRRWVFELAYGLYDKRLAELDAQIRQLNQDIRATESENEVVRRFLTGTAIGESDGLNAELDQSRITLRELKDRQHEVRERSLGDPAGYIARQREHVLSLRQQVDSFTDDLRAADRQINNLSDLERQLSSLSKRLTRSIVADEWMVDFEFVVCPRCGQHVDSHRTEEPICYLCEQPEPNTATNRESLIREQDRVTFQIAETRELLAERRDGRRRLADEIARATAELTMSSGELDATLADFVSSHASEMKSVAAEIGTVEANIRWTQRVLTLFEREASQQERLDHLRQQKADLEEQIEGHRVSISLAEDNIIALEGRMLEYLQRLHVPTLGDMLTVRISRSTYLPEISSRTFDELSSQGLKTLVNVAHALAHHTVAIDRDLTMPGLLVLDGVSANAGKEGLNGDRVLDMYRLFSEVADHYGDRLQLIVVDNELPQEIVEESSERIALTLSQSERLIVTSAATEDTDLPEDVERGE
jgi:hypothetical protein